MIVDVQVASLTEDDLARIAERERQERGIDNGNVNPDAASGTNGPRSAILNDDPLVELASRQSNGTGSIRPPSFSPPKSRLLMGVPIAEGANLTKFLYVEVPEDRKEGSNGKDRSLDSSQFDVEEAAARLCADLHGEGGQGKIFLECLSSLKVTLSSR